MTEQSEPTQAIERADARLVPPRPGEALIGVQRRWRELGRFRMGATRPGPKGPVPYKLNTWRLTSHSRDLLEHVAVLYGGEVVAWPEAPTDGDNWQITTEADSLRVIVPPGEVLSQYFELWSGGGCRKRCTGERQVLQDIPCSCPEDIGERSKLAQRGQACTPSTRLSLMLLDVPDLGVWRLETHGYTAAQEIAGTFDVLKLATDRGTPIPAQLKITHRTSKSIDAEGNAKTAKFTVPALVLEEQIVRAVMDSLPQLGQAPRETLAPPIERRSLPGAPAPLTTDEGQDHQGAMFGLEEPDFPTDPAEKPEGMPSWIMELPGYDPEIIDAANLLAAEKGLGREFVSLWDFAAAPQWFREALADKLAGGSNDAGS